MRNKPGRRRFTEEQRQQLVEEFNRRDEEAQEFARQHGVGISTLYQWVRRSSRQPRGKVPPKLQFREMTLPAPAGPIWAAEVCLPDGSVVRWNGTTGLDGTKRLVRQLRRPC